MLKFGMNIEMNCISLYEKPFSAKLKNVFVTLCDLLGLVSEHALPRACREPELSEETRFRGLSRQTRIHYGVFHNHTYYTFVRKQRTVGTSRSKNL
jgi:hypothetical protein